MAYLVSEFRPTPTSRNFDKVKPDCKLSGKCLVFHSNILISLKIAEFRTPTPQTLLGTPLFRAADQKYLESFEMWCWRRMEKIRLANHVRNEEVLLRVNEQRNILHEIRKRKAK